jgi:alpha-tubulin suppressor-like RCC1 family protein
MLQNSSKTVRCWGENSQLGQGPEAPLYVGDDEPPSSIGPVDVGGAVIDLAVGDDHSCALLVGGGVRCWGSNIHGELGQGEIFFPGYFDGVPSAWPLVSLGDVPVVDNEAGGGDHTCAPHEDHTVHCWGKGERGELGYGNGTTEYVGDDELPSSVGTVPVGGPVDQLAVGCANTCVRVGAKVKCWGHGSYGTNGYPGIAGLIDDLGDDELPSSYGWVNTGFKAPTLGAGCIRVYAYVGPYLRAWGWGMNFGLGYGNTANIGDDETPASAGNVPYQ